MTVEKVGFLEELAWRGLLYQRTAEEALDAHLASGSRVGYCGFDPTADSLTHGNLVPIQMLVHWQRAGHAPVALIGGGTGLIGDPSERDQERPLLTRDEVRANVAGQRRIFEKLLAFDGPAGTRARVVDNADWLAEIPLLTFLRDVGKHFSVNALLQREAIRARIEDRAQGISFTEFSYTLLQGYDFLHLHREIGCTVQIAGSDQFGNVVSGIDLIHRSEGHDAEAFGITAPLVTRSDGKKFSKSEGGAVWLTEDRTSPYAFHQYWLNVPDADVGRFLRIFTLLGREEIEALEARQAGAPHERPGQRALAAELTDRLHGQDERKRVEGAAEALFGRGDPRSIDARTLAQVVLELPRSEHARDALGGEGASLVDTLPETTLAGSRREARQLLESGAVSVNGRRSDEPHRLRPDDLLGGSTILLRRGKKHWHATHWV